MLKVSKNKKFTKLTRYFYLNCQRACCLSADLMKTVPLLLISSPSGHPSIHSMLDPTCQHTLVYGGRELQIYRVLPLLSLPLFSLSLALSFFSLALSLFLSLCHSYGLSLLMRLSFCLSFYKNLCAGLRVFSFLFFVIFILSHFQTFTGSDFSQQPFFVADRLLRLVPLYFSAVFLGLNVEVQK